MVDKVTSDLARNLNMQYVYLFHIHFRFCI